MNTLTNEQRRSVALTVVGFLLDLRAIGIEDAQDAARLFLQLVPSATAVAEHLLECESCRAKYHDSLRAEHRDALAKYAAALTSGTVPTAGADA